MEGDETTIQNNYLRPEFVETAKCFTSWYEKGYVYKDGANFDEAAETLISANTAFGYFSTVPVGSEADVYKRQIFIRMRQLTPSLLQILLKQMSQAAILWIPSLAWKPPRALPQAMT